MRLACNVRMRHRRHRAPEIRALAMGLVELLADQGSELVGGDPKVRKFRFVVRLGTEVKGIGVK
jgi:hypothetical protein